MDSLKSIVHRDSPNAKKGGSTSPKTKHARDGSAASSSSAGAMPPPAAPHQPAPPSAQNAAYAAFAPEPGSRSEAREFGAANPAAARVSPGLQAGAHTDAAARQRAEQSAYDLPARLTRQWWRRSASPSRACPSTRACRATLSCWTRWASASASASIRLTVQRRLLQRLQGVRLGRAAQSGHQMRTQVRAQQLAGARIDPSRLACWHGVCLGA